MKHSTQSALKQAIEACAAEPIHHIGNIQPHGALLALSADFNRTVIQASANIGYFIDLPPEGALGKPLAELIGNTSAIQIESLIQDTKTHMTATGVVSVSQQQASIDIDAHVYIADDRYVVELCRDNGLPSREKLGDLLIQMQDTLLAIELEAESTHYFEQIVQLIRTLSSYDSVMVYRFDANWDGEVITQNSIETAPSFLGVHFPANDIPAQARYLYTKNLVRIVTDATAKPVPIVPALTLNNQRPLDMTYSALRSLSPTHMDYLSNMGVKASMVISLMENGRLWGLISCHHMSPKRVSFAMREAAIFIGRMVSRKLTSITILEENQLLDKTMHIKAAFLKTIYSQSVTSIIKNQSLDLLNLVNATGLIIIVEGTRYLHGLVPAMGDIDKLLDWLIQQKTDHFSCDKLSDIFPPAIAYQDIASGLITTSLLSDMQNSIIWLRKDKPRSIKWAGSYEEGLQQKSSGDFHLTPRKSFENWTELWLGHAEPWTTLEIKIVNSFGQALSESLAQKQRNQLTKNENIQLNNDLKANSNFIVTENM